MYSNLLFISMNSEIFTSCIIVLTSPLYKGGFEFSKFSHKKGVGKTGGSLVKRGYHTNTKHLLNLSFSLSGVSVWLIDAIYIGILCVSLAAQFFLI